MAETVLSTIKGAIGISSDVTDFDIPLVLEINTALATLNQLGFGEEPVVITSETEWDDVLGDATNLEDFKSYIWYSVRLSFDPPSNSFLVTAIEKRIDELAWRIKVKLEPEPTPEEEEEDEEE